MIERNKFNKEVLKAIDFNKDLFSSLIKIKGRQPNRGIINNNFNYFDNKFSNSKEN